MKNRIIGKQRAGNAKTVFSAILAVAVCLLGQPALASLDNPVSRPVKVTNSHGHLLITVQPSGDYEFIDWGTASHLGQFENSGTGVLDLTTGVFLSGTGTLVAADGDTIDWKVWDGGINTVTYTGGTGRFAGVTGLFPVTITSQTLISADPITGALTLLMTYEGEGVISY